MSALAEQSSHYSAIKKKFYPVSVPKKVIEQDLKKPAAQVAAAPTPIRKPTHPPSITPAQWTDMWLVTEATLPQIDKIKIEDIQVAVCAFFDVSYLDMLSQRRTAAIVRPRQLAMYLSKALTLNSLPEIGRRFNGRDHTTVLHAVRKIEGLVTIDRELDGQIYTLKQRLRPA